MKSLLFACCMLLLVVPTAVQAGINGVYKVKGKEIDGKDTYNFTGTVKVSNYKTGSYVLDLGDGEGLIKFKFSFSKRLSDTKKTQTVTYSNDVGSGSATFTRTGKKYTVTFNYREKGSGIRGSGKGSK